MGQGTVLCPKVTDDQTSNSTTQNLAKPGAVRRSLPAPGGSAETASKKAPFFTFSIVDPSRVGIVLPKEPLLRPGDLQVY